MAVSDTIVVAEERPVHWDAVLAGGSIATAIGLVLLGFGAALGLSVSSPYEGEGLSPAAYAVAAGLYLLWVQLMSFYFGGYVAARLAPRSAGLSEHEADVRDGLHGALVWAVGVIAAAVIAFAGLTGAATAARTSEGAGDPIASVSRVIESEVNEGAAVERVEGSDEAATATATERRAEVVRKLSVISAFITAASLLVAAVAAFLGAHHGGNHRDRSVMLPFFRRTL